MSNLDLKIPPPVVVLFCAAFAWLLARFSPGFTYLLHARILITLLLVLAGISIALLGVLAFRKAKTTPNPHAPEKKGDIYCPEWTLRVHSKSNVPWASFRPARLLRLPSKSNDILCPHRIYCIHHPIPDLAGRAGSSAELR